MLALLAAAVVGGAAGPAIGQQPARRVLVLQLNSDFLERREARLFDKAVRDEVAVAMPGYLVLPRPPLDLASMKVAAGCVTDGPKCIALIGRTAQADWVLQVSLLGSERRARLTVRRVDSRRASDNRYEDELTDLGPASVKEVRWHIATALGAQPPPLMGQINVFNAATGRRLSAMAVLLDDRPVPVSALRQVNPGRHRVEIRKDGFKPYVWTGSVRPGRQTDIQVTLVPRRAPPRAVVAPREPAPTISSTDESDGPVWTWVLGAGAVVAAGTATVFGVRVLGLESEAEDLGLDCDGASRDEDTCSDGRSARHARQRYVGGCRGVSGCRRHRVLHRERQRRRGNGVDRGRCRSDRRRHVGVGESSLLTAGARPR